MKKTCIRCNKEKDISCFPVDNRLKREDKTTAACKDCKRLYHKEWYKRPETRERILKQSSDWYYNNREKALARAAKNGKKPERVASRKKYYENVWKGHLKDTYDYKYLEDTLRNSPEKMILARAKSRAKKLGIPFNLVLDDIKIPEFCPILGVKLEPCSWVLNNSHKGKDSSPSIDKINPKGGYTKDNIIIISNRANILKGNASLEELEKIYKFYCNLEKEKTNG